MLVNSKLSIHATREGFPAKFGNSTPQTPDFSIQSLIQSCTNNDKDCHTAVELQVCNPNSIGHLTLISQKILSIQMYKSKGPRTWICRKCRNTNEMNYFVHYFHWSLNFQNINQYCPWQIYSSWSCGRKIKGVECFEEGERGKWRYILTRSSS